MSALVDQLVAEAEFKDAEIEKLRAEVDRLRAEKACLIERLEWHRQGRPSNENPERDHAEQHVEALQNRVANIAREAIERCAEVCEKVGSECDPFDAEIARECAAAIRAMK